MLATATTLVALLVSVTGAPLAAITTAVCYPTANQSSQLRAPAFGSVTLTVAPGRWVVPGQVEFNTRAYYYQGVQTIPGPTIRVKAGTQCQVTLINALSTAGAALCQHQMASMVPGQMGIFHCPDNTNLHTHGARPPPPPVGFAGAR